MWTRQLRSCGYFNEEPAMNAQVRFSRRDFLITSAVVGGGMAIAILQDPADAAFVDPQPWNKPQARNATDPGPLGLHCAGR
jgi:hypothetical protein